MTAGCGNAFDNVSGKTVLGEENIPPDAGVPDTTSVTITPTGKDLSVLALSAIQPLRVTTVHTPTNAIALQVEILSESAEYGAVHLREIEKGASASGIYSTDSALGCHYSIGNPGTPRAYVAALSGSCVHTLAVELPDHEIPRAFLGTTPLFSGEIDLADLKAVYTAAGHDPNLPLLLRAYVARLPAAVKPLSVADVGAFLLPLGDDARRIDAVALLAPRVSDAAQAENLPREAFTSPASRAQAVKILLAYQ
jgi:hypothetical protein